jgi:two-component system phosphate regulon sensor histidine kinase PhoR
MRREFTANVSHELKTPLTSISGFAEIMRNGMVKNEDITRFAGYIYDETQRLISLVGDIIKLSQLDDNELPVEKVRLDLYDACEAVITTLKRRRTPGVSPP